jgi:hypothetical protein
MKDGCCPFESTRWTNGQSQRTDGCVHNVILEYLLPYLAQLSGCKRRNKARYFQYRTLVKVQ